MHPQVGGIILEATCMYRQHCRRVRQVVNINSHRRNIAHNGVSAHSFSHICKLSKTISESVYET